MDKNFILESIRDLRGEDLANSLAEHAKDVSWVESEDRNIPQFGGGPARGIYQYEIKGTKDGSGASETALNRFYNYISKNNLSIPLEYEDELKNLSDKNNPDFTELSTELQSQIFYADKALGKIPLDKLVDGSLSSRDAWVKYHQAGSEKERPDKEEQFDRAMRTRPATIKEGSDSVDAQTDQMLSEEQLGSTFRSKDDTVPSDTGTVTGDQAEKEPGFLDTVGEYVGDAYDTASEYVSETVDTLEGVAESVGDKLRRLLGSEEEQQSSSSNDTPPLPTPRPDRTDTPPLPTPRPDRTDTPPLPTPRPDRTDTPPLPTPRPDRTDTPPLPTPRPDRTEDAFSAVVDFVNTLKKAEGGSVEKKAEFIKKDDDDDDDVPDPPPGATPEEVADDIPAYLSTGEYVLPANVVRYIGLKNITGMHQRALSELQQMEDLDIIENVDENGYVEEDDDEMDYMEPEEAGVVEIVVAEHHPKGLMAMGFAEGGMINSDSSMEEGQVLPTSDIFSEGVYAQANINRSVDSEDVVESDKVITAPIAFSSAPGKTAYLAYITPEEAASLRQAKQGFSSEGNGLEVSDGQYQHLGPKGLMSFNGEGGGKGGGGSGSGGSGSGKGGGDTGGGKSDSKADDEDDATDPGVAAVAASESPLGGVVGDINEALGFDRAHGFAGKGVTDTNTGEVYGPGGLASVSRSYTEKDVKDPKSVATAVGMGLGSIAGSLAGIGQAAVNAAVEAGVDVQGPSTNDIGGGSQEFYEEEKADTDSTKTTDTDPLSDYIYVPGVGYRRKVRSVKPLSELKAGGYVTRNGIMARGYSKGGDPGDGHGGGMSEPVEDLEPEDVEEEKPTDPYEGYTYVKGIGYVPTSRRATSNKPIESASLALSSIFTPSFLSTIGIMGDPNEEL
jgi:hypothetical protein